MEGNCRHTCWIDKDFPNEKPVLHWLTLSRIGLFCHHIHSNNPNSFLELVGFPVLDLPDSFAQLTVNILKPRTKLIQSSKRT
jgi:hypothetical protein